MAFAPIEKPLYPNVPQSPGVPPVMRSAGAIENTVVAVASDAISLVKQFLGVGPQWGIFDPKTGQPVFVSDSVVALDYRQEWDIATYPIERGAFIDYNKVKRPFDVRLTFSFAGNQGIGGSLIPGGALLSMIPGFSGSDSRRTMLQQLDAAIATFDLFTVITPEAQYPMVNIVHYDYRRQARSGAALIQVDVWCQEVRSTARTAFSKSGKLTGTDPITDQSNLPNSAGGTGGQSGTIGTGQGTAGTGNPQGSDGDASSSGTGSGNTSNANAPRKAEGGGPVSGGTVQPSPTAQSQPIDVNAAGVQHGPIDIGLSPPTPGGLPAGQVPVVGPGGQYMGNIGVNAIASPNRGFTPWYEGGVLKGYIWAPP